MQPPSIAPTSPRLELVIAAPCCTLGAYIDAKGWITEIRFLPAGHELLPARSESAMQVERALRSYLDKPDAPIEKLPLALRGSNFQREVWRAIDAIPCGQTRTYGELAQQLFSHPRAVGQACGANPFPIITPCHRVIGRGGAGGFAHARDGWLISAKQWLLMHEGAL